MIIIQSKHLLKMLVCSLILLFHQMGFLSNIAGQGKNALR